MNMLPDFWYLVLRVRAKRTIRDSPLAKEDDTVQRGAVGHIEDIADNFLWVDFGGGVIACDPDEVTPV